ncbi:Copper homeostasis protein CutC [Fulvia fulva]|nr:Copper homeostasis protein CutC [Fulvia fulva]
MADQLEICRFNLESALIAAREGAHRIELCQHPELQGTTPPREWLIAIKDEYPEIPVFIMIRPRGRNFVYGPSEIQQMKDCIESFKDIADGFVTGCLTEMKEVDIPKTTELVQAAAPLPCTFHKAFDEIYFHHRALEDVISTGCSALLTSGGEKTAAEATDSLKTLVARAIGRIDIIAAGGIRADNVDLIKDYSEAQWIHSSAIREGSSIADADEIKAMLKVVDPMGQGERDMAAMERDLLTFPKKE